MGWCSRLIGRNHPKTSASTESPSRAIAALEDFFVYSPENLYHIFEPGVSGNDIWEFRNGNRNKLIPFPKFGNRKGMEKKHSQNLGSERD